MPYSCTLNISSFTKCLVFYGPQCRFSYLLLRIQLLLFVTTAFFSARNNMKCIRMHDRYKFPSTLDKCYILSKGYFL